MPSPRDVLRGKISRRGIFKSEDGREAKVTFGPKHDAPHSSTVLVAHAQINGQPYTGLFSGHATPVNMRAATPVAKYKAARNGQEWKKDA